MSKKDKMKIIISISIAWAIAFLGMGLKCLDENLSAKFYPQTLVVIEANHTENWTGNMICERFSDYSRKLENKIAYDLRYVISEDPEDIEVGDVLAVVMNKNGTENIDDDTVVSYRVAK